MTKLWYRGEEIWKELGEMEGKGIKIGSRSSHAILC